ncbi:hypothetical protein HNR53_003801 [Bacillus benzoevorans]|uniref:Uncharacterized protein n=1 Tax=Bacillus benzoevorans TaxID=1456 RepID=A0A7X0HWB7_9BACI|nr:hypothetical protein [Bacillus benzoevorans]
MEIGLSKTGTSSGKMNMEFQKFLPLKRTKKTKKGVLNVILIE